MNNEPQIFIRAGGQYLSCFECYGVVESPSGIHDESYYMHDICDANLFHPEDKDYAVALCKRITPARPIEIIEHRVVESVA